MNVVEEAPSVEQRVTGGLIGLLVGDALGVPYEFHDERDIPAAGLIEFEPPRGFLRSHGSVLPGTWSDDGAQALCLLASLLDCERLDVDDFADRLVRWYDEGYLAVGGAVFDIGITTGYAIRALKRGVPAIMAGPNDVHDNGNGSLMRVLPLALWHQGDDEQLVIDAHMQSMVTHGHARAQVCCALYCLWARRQLAGSREPWLEAVHAIKNIYAEDSEHFQELEWSRSFALRYGWVTIPIPRPA